jgi:adenylate cyclase class IV
MGYNNREIEKKYVVTDPKNTFNKVAKILTDNFSDRFLKNCWDGGTSKDFYWKSPNARGADFVRLRFMPDGSGQLTLKKADRGTNVDRIEIDVEVKNPKQTYKFLSQLLGKPLGKIQKNYQVTYLDDGGSNISVYKVHGNPAVFIEIEARSLSYVNKIEKKLSGFIAIKQERRSLYQVFFGGKK